MEKNKYYSKPLVRLLLLYLMENDDFVENEEAFFNYHSDATEIISSIIEDKNDIELFDYEIQSIDNSNDYLKIVPMNLSTALWFHGIGIHNPTIIESDKELVFNDEKFIFDETTNSLKIEKFNK